MSVLDGILKKNIFEGPETVNADWESPSLDIDNREGEFGVLISYDNGASVNMTLQLQYSPNNINWFDAENGDQLITDNAGNHYWDIPGTGASFVRVIIDVTSGNIDVTKISLNGKRRH